MNLRLITALMTVSLTISLMTGCSTEQDSAGSSNLSTTPACLPVGNMPLVKQIDFKDTRHGYPLGPNPEGKPLNHQMRNVPDTFSIRNGRRIIQLVDSFEPLHEEVQQFRSMLSDEHPQETRKRGKRQ